MDPDLIVTIIGGKYPRHVVECVMRHTAGSADTLISLLLNGIDVAEWLAKDEALMAAAKSPPTVFDCELCFCEFEVSQMYTVDCAASHRFCFECIGRMVEMNIRENTEAVCPGGECNHVMSEIEVMQTVGEGELLTKFRTQQLTRAITSIPGAIPCPTADCTGYEIASMPGEKERVTCSVCRAVFCSLCKNQYHYKYECGQVQQAERAWLEWVTSGRRAYLDQLAAADAEYEERISEFNEAREAHQREVEAALQRLRENENDEEWKAANCRCCPSCGRVINRVAGCSSMVCGRVRTVAEPSASTTTAVASPAFATWMAVGVPERERAMTASVAAAPA